jgi:polyferredoxin
MSSSSVESFITGPFNMVSDARMLHFFTSPSLLSILIIGALVLFTLIFRNAWCRYLCPYGMLLGLFSWFSFVAVTRDEASCIGCARCTKGCPAGIRVEDKLAVHTPECIGCAECIGQCPVEGCLSFKAFGRVKLPWYAVGVGAVAVLLAFYVWAKMTGHWEGMPPFMYQKVYPMFLGKG